MSECVEQFKSCARNVEKESSEEEDRVMSRTKAEKIAAAKKRHGFTAVNKPRRGGPKKFEVLAVEGDTVKKVNFGDPAMSIKKDQPKRKASYCARSGGIKGKSSKLSANYWSRKAWDC